MATRELHDLILSFRFDLAEERCRTHPLDVEFRCARGYTPLHRLVCSRGIAAVAIAAAPARLHPPPGGVGPRRVFRDPIVRTARAIMRAAEAIGFEGLGGSEIVHGGETSGAVRLACDRGNRAMWSPLHLLCQLGTGSGQEGSGDLVRCLLLMDDCVGVEGEVDDSPSPEGTPLGGRQADAFKRRRARHLASLRDRQGRTPLHLLCERHVPTDDEIVEVLLEAEPGVVLCRDRRGDSPLSHLLRFGDCGDVTHRFLRRLLSAAEGALQPNREGPIIQHGEFSESVVGNYRYTETECRAPFSRRNLVHSSVRMPSASCPPSVVVRVIANENPRFVRERDENGDLPIHVFASSSYGCFSYDSTIRTIQLADSFRSHGGTRHLTTLRHETRADPYNQIAPSRFDMERSNAFAALLNSYIGSAAILSGSGMLPLQLASASGTTWAGGIATLLCAHPPALAAMDLDTVLYPRILSLAGSPEKLGLALGKVNCVGLLYEIVKTKPDLMGFHVEVQGNNISNEEETNACGRTEYVWKKSQGLSWFRGGFRYHEVSFHHAS